MAKVYEAMLLSQENAPEETKQFLQDYNFSEVLPDPVPFAADADPLDLDELGLFPPAPAMVTNSIGANVAVAEAIAETVTTFASSMQEASPLASVFSTPPPPLAMPAAPPQKNFVSAPYRTEFRQLSEVLLRTAAERILKAVVVCGVDAQDRAEFVWENLSLSLAENPDLRIARFNLLSPAPAAAAVPTSGNFQIKIQRTPIPNLCEILPLNGAVPIGQLLRECDIAKMLEMLKARFDFVLLETDAVNWTDEVATFAGQSDGVILVAQKESMRGPAMNTARQKLHEANAQILGAVLSRTHEQEQFQRVA
ncbi:MAG: hypothetical protein U0Y68_20445 [Blastocatellia bacterium]